MTGQKPLRVLVTGSREWWDKGMVAAEIVRVATENSVSLHDVVVVHGDCPIGADMIAERFCFMNDIKTEPHPADWDRYGRTAGFLRNTQMVALGADICLAFWNGTSHGTADTIAKARRAGIPVRVVLPHGND
jgi:hypothetical protein